MERRIVGFHTDAESDWVAELDCGHNQHVRHRPPFQLRPWVLHETGRAARLGTSLDCPLCERCEWPEGLQLARRSAEWDARSLPPGLRSAHSLAAGTWGRLVVEEGHVSFHACTVPPIDRLLEAREVQAIPPSVEHEIELEGDARLFLEFLKVVPFTARRRPQLASRGPSEPGPAAAGDPACWAHLLCAECGSAPSEKHRAGCSLAEQAP